MGAVFALTDADTWLYAQKLLVELFVRLSESHPLLQQAENEVPLGAGLEQQVVGAVDLLGERQSLPEAMNPLVKLRALDRYLLQDLGWVLSPSTWMKLDDGRLFLLYKRPLYTRRALIQGKMGHLRTWVEHHWLLPKQLYGYGIELVEPSRLLSEGFEQLRQRHEQPRVAIAHFEDGVGPRWREELRPGRLQASDLTNPERRWESVLVKLEHAVVQKVHVLVLPELTVTPVLRQRIQKWLFQNRGRHSLLLVLPGSFHEPDGVMPCEASNRTQLLDGAGYVVLEHHKLVKYGSVDEFEHINPGSRIRLLSLPVGLLATPICLDFCQADHPIRTLWKVLGPDLLLVPAMGGPKSLSAHQKAARDLHITQGSWTVLANQSDEAAPAPGFIGEVPKVAASHGAPGPANAFQLSELKVWPDEDEQGNTAGPSTVN